MQVKPLFPPTHCRKLSGFSLMEVLVTMLVMAFGVLGLAGLQLAALRDNHVSAVRSLAAQQVYDMADRMRSNIAGVSLGGYSNLTGAGSDPGCISTGCTPALTTQYDFYAWNVANAQVLPAGAGTVCLDSDNDTTSCDGLGDAYRITVTWGEKDSSGATVTKSYSVKFQP